jgi:hypothetical protein
MHRVLLSAIAAAIVVLHGAPAEAHGFSSVVYADVTSVRENHVGVKLGLEYDLLVVSVASAQKDDPFFREGQPAWDASDYPGMRKAANDHSASIEKYIAKRFTVKTGAGTRCAPTIDGPIQITPNKSQDVAYASAQLDYACPAMGKTEHGHTLQSTLFPDAEGFVKETKTVLTYEFDGRSGSAALDDTHPSFSTEQPWNQRFWEFFRLGGQHLLTGLDHILFLLALIAGSRRLREVVMVATAFTLAHSVTFILAALGVVSPPAGLVEPIIALSIAAVAGWHLWRLWRRGAGASDFGTSRTGHFSLDRAGWLRLSIVFCFGLAHGLGFASALGITSSFSWQLLWSLLVFNLGIEAVQIALIVVTFPLLMMLRRRSPAIHAWMTGAIAAGVTVMGLIWFVERVS